MTRKRISKIKNAEHIVDGPSYVTYQDGDKDSQDLAMAAMNRAVNEYGIVNASSRLDFNPSNSGGNGISGRYGFTHQDYETWRPGEASSFKNIKENILHADICYKRHGLIKNVIDLMGDFASQGIRLVHPNKRIEKFFQNWFRKINGVERSERFLNNLYRLGNVVSRIQTAKLTSKQKETMFRARANPDMEVQESKTVKGEIPWKVTYLHPATIDIAGGALANFSGNPQYMIRLPKNLSKLITSPKNAEEQKIVNELPREIIEAARLNKAIPLPQEKTKVFHYKKDDWEDWAYPIISSIALDISLYEKLKLADRAALDGAISNLRIIKLGSLEHKIAPTEHAAAKLASILASNTEAGCLDLIWGPDIELIESKTAVHNFLGQAKYEPTLLAIYAGLGIPPTLTGTFGTSGTTNNFISLKTLIQRLEYGRDTLITFWNGLIKEVQEAMGFRFPARVEFDLMNLGDEIAEKSLLIQLSDRNLISDELIQRYFGSDPEMERIRTNIERRERDKDTRAEKAGPFYNPQIEEALKKIFAQNGIVTPSEVGLELEDRKKGEIPGSLIENSKRGTRQSSKNKGVSGQGRPVNKKDSSRRKEKQFNPKVKASVVLWAKEAQDTIADVINPIALEKFNKKNMRMLSTQETEYVEKLKFGVLCNLEPRTKVNGENISSALHKNISNQALNTYNSWSKQISNDLNKTLTIDERKYIQAHVYATLKGEINGNF